MPMRGTLTSRPEYQSVVEMWNRNVVPAETGCGTGLESRNVVCEMGYDHFHNLRGESM